MAPRLRKLRGCWARRLPVAPGGARARISAAPGASGTRQGAPPALSASRVMPSGPELLSRPPQGDASRRTREPRTPTSARPASSTSARGSDLRSRSGARRAAGVAAGAAPPGGDDLATVALVLLRLGGRRLAARQSPSAPSRHVSGARALRDAVGGEPAPYASAHPRPAAVLAAAAVPSRKGWRAGVAGGHRAGSASSPRRSAAGTLSPARPRVGDEDPGGLGAFHLTDFLSA